MQLRTEPQFDNGGEEPGETRPRVVDLRSQMDALSLPGLAPWTRLMLSLAPRAQHGSLTVLLPDHRAVRVTGAKPGRHATLELRSDRVARRLLTGGSLGFAESYLDGEWDSPDLAGLTEWACQNEDLDDTLAGKRWARVLRRIAFMLQANTRKGSRRNIAYHYDLGNAFYRLWLDPGMTYSSALYAHPGQELEAAQENKYRRLAEAADIRAGHRVLEIGCGWGGMASHLARERGASVHAITISREQYDYARQRVFEAGLADRVNIELRDYRDLTATYDRVVSVEMFEAVGESYWPTYFGKVRDSLKPDGVAGLQVITIADRFFEAYRGSMDFIQKYIFPGGMLPSPEVFRQRAGAAGLKVAEEFTFGEHYADTLATWRQRFAARWDEVAPLGFDERFRRMWTYYLAYCEGGFRAGTIDVMQVRLERN